MFHGEVPRVDQPIPVGHDALAHDLAMWLTTPPRGTFRGRLTWENVEFPDHRCRPDVFALWATLTPQKWSPTTFEVKTSRSDFRSEIRSGKWRCYRPFSAYTVIAAPDGLISAEELPPELGLIVRKMDGWRQIKRGARNPDWKLTDRLWMNLCLKERNPSPYELYRGLRVAA